MEKYFYFHLSEFLFFKLLLVMFLRKQQKMDKNDFYRVSFRPVKTKRETTQSSGFSFCLKKCSVCATALTSIFAAVISTQPDRSLWKIPPLGLCFALFYVSFI